MNTDEKGFQLRRATNQLIQGGGELGFASIVPLSEKEFMFGKRNSSSGNTFLSRFAVGLGMLAITTTSQALYTNFLNDSSNTLVATYTSLTNNPSPTRQDRHDTAAIRKALKEFHKPSASVAMDFGLFGAAAMHLGTLTLSPDLLPVLTNAFIAFLDEAHAEINLTEVRTAALNNFVRAKKPASNQVAQAQIKLNSISAVSDLRAGIRLGRQMFMKIVTANRLASIAEMHPGFALDSITGKTLHYGVANGLSGFVAFTNSTQYEQAEITSEHSVTTDEGTYAYNRIGLNRSQLVLNGSGNTNVVKLTYRSLTNGTLTIRSVSGGAAQSGTFTLD